MKGNEVTVTPSRFLRPPLLAMVGLLVAMAATLWIGAASAAAAEPSTEISIEGTNGEPHPSGAAATYRIYFSCSSNAGTGIGCGENPTIRIPLTLTAPLLENTPSMTGWQYSTGESIQGLIKEAKVVGGEYVIELDPEKFNPGDSDTIELSVTPPNGTTPNGTSWELKPSLEVTGIPTSEAPEAAKGKATAEVTPAVTKKTRDEGGVYVRGHNVVFNITARCNPGGSTGKLFMENGSVVDTLPPELEYISATPEPDVHPEEGGHGEIAWNYPDATNLPPGCANNNSGTANYQVVARVPASGEDEQLTTNSVTFTGTPLDESPKSTTAPLTLKLINEAPEPGELGTDFLTKGALAPICIGGEGPTADECVSYAGTYPGHWITPANASPSTNPGSAEGRYEVKINYPASRAYETALVDPVPCLDEEPSSGKYVSEPVPEPVDSGPAPVCAHPAFNPTAVRVDAPSLEEALKEGWAPKAILTDGTPITLVKASGSGGSAYFDIPSENLGEVAAIVLPPNKSLTDNKMTMNVFGYADGGLQSGDTLEDVAVASAYPIGSKTATGTSHDEAKIYIEPKDVQLGIEKSFSGRNISLVGSLAVPLGKTLPGDVVLADLLPEEMTWGNPTSSAVFNVTRNLGTLKEVTATIEHLPNYEGLERELIRVTLPKAAFEEGGAGGFFTIRPKQSNLFEMKVPNETRSFLNTAEIFVKGIERNTAPVCGSGQGTGTKAEIGSKDEHDLSGDGEEEENFCKDKAELKVTATGPPAFSLRKYVQGELDPQRKGAGGIGTTTRAGTGIFSFSWWNASSISLEKPVIYDILPYVGDTGVDQGQSGVQRESEFATEFVEVVQPLPGEVEVEYSESTNPCRPEVDPGATGCVEDWTADVPSEPGKVKALKFSSPETYKPGSPAQNVEIKVRLPYGDVNDIAWNSAAINAQEAGSGKALKAAEPPKVGITAPAPLVTPTVSTAVSSASILPGKPVHDTITVENTDERTGTVKWKLLGPVAPAGDGSCTGVDWGTAPTTPAAEGNFPLDAGATKTTADTTTSNPTGHGCYGYEVEVEGSGFTTAKSAVGSAGEVLVVHPATPTLSTAVSSDSVLPGTNVTDAITVNGTEGYPGTVKWKLLGPVAPAGDGSCTGVDWGTAPATPAAEGSFPVTADGTTDTDAAAPTAHGCYGYEVTLEGQDLATAASSVGSAGEVLVVHPATPTLSTQVSSESVLPGTDVTDAVTIAGTEGFPGTVTWKLFGPATPAADGTCTDVDWSTAPATPAAEGSFPITADGTTETDAAAPTAHGCYGYEVTLEGEHLTTVTSQVGADGEVFLVHPATPALSTAVSSDSVLPGAEVTDAIRIAGTEGFAGTVKWRLLGPVTPAADGSCNGVDWNGAAAFAEGEFEVEEDGTTDTAVAKPTAHGCYGYEATVEGEHLTKATSPVGSAGEVVLVHPATPTVATTASSSSDSAGAQASDQIKVDGTAGFAGTVHWKLAGPVSPAADGGCSGLDWNGAATVAEGDIAVSGDATVQTPATTLQAAGCYGYQVTLEGEHLTKATSPLGAAGETVLIKAPVPPAATGTPDLRIVKRVAEGKVEVGKPLHYTIEVENKGDGPATKTVVTDTPRSPLEFVSAKPSQGSCGKSFPLTCKLGTLAAGAKATIKVVAKSLAGGKVLNSAIVKSPDEHGNKGVKAAAASRALIPLRLSKTVAKKTVEAGERVHYAITVTNPTSATAHGVKVCDRLPAGLAYVSSSPPAKVSNGSYCWKIATLKGHATKKIRVVARALAGAGGKLVNVAVLSGADAVHRKATAAVHVKAAPAREGGVTG
ncbi:MAG TPA: DUF11 domain-containing protein [Solirubrobacterales bacterium]|nr:DUF11 domain-containing protein [Solirubrobacterales bacterium]